MAKPAWGSMKASPPKKATPNTSGSKGKIIKSQNTVTRKGKPSFGAK